MTHFLRFASKESATWVWLLLAAATATSWLVGSGSRGDASQSLAGVSTLLVGIALIKVRLVIRHFMEVRHAPLPLQLATDAWCLVVGVAILVLSRGWFAL